jgi:tetratricopeptide (TPR) repeat protein
MWAIRTARRPIWSIGGNCQVNWATAPSQYHNCNGQVLVAQGRIEEAIAELKAGIEHADQVNDLESGVPGCKALAEAYERLGDYRMALHWHREFHEHYVRYCTHTAQRSAPCRDPV